MSVLARDVAELWPTWTDPAKWTDRAACRGLELNTFFPSKGGSSKAAKATCSTCRVVVDCRKAADRAERGLPPSAIFGVFSGETPAERIVRRVHVKEPR